jgi:hypothetical protein
VVVAVDGVLVVIDCATCAITEAMVITEGPPGVAAVAWTRDADWRCDACPDARTACAHVLAAVEAAAAEVTA